MNHTLMRIISQITEEEQRILDGDKNIHKEYYTSFPEFIVDCNHLLDKGELINIRTHTRFIDFPLHKHNYIEMMYICRGSITNIINGSKIVMEEGDILILSQQTYHALETADENDIGINFVILPEFFDKAMEMLELKQSNALVEFLIGMLRQSGSTGQYLHFALKKDLRVENLMENLIYSLINKQDNEIVINKITMTLIFMCLIQNITALRHDAPNNYEKVMTHSVLRYIDEHYKTASLTELAQNFNQSLTAMSRFIKKQTTCTFKELLQRKRFQVAMRLLCDTDLPINDIVVAVGYENNSYFHRRFREKYNMSPGEFKKSHRPGSQIIF